MSLKKTLLFMLILTCIITTVHFLWISAVYAITGVLINPHLQMNQLYRYPLTSLISVLPTLLFITNDQVTNLGWKIRVIAHFFLTMAFALVSWIIIFSDWDGWHLFSDNIWRFCVVFTVIYVSAYLAFAYQQRRLANKFNACINKKKFK